MCSGRRVSPGETGQTARLLGDDRLLRDCVFDCVGWRECFCRAWALAAAACGLGRGFSTGFRAVAKEHGGVLIEVGVPPIPQYFPPSAQSSALGRPWEIELYGEPMSLQGHSHVTVAGCPV